MLTIVEGFFKPFIVIVWLLDSDEPTFPGAKPENDDGKENVWNPTYDLIGQFQEVSTRSRGGIVSLARNMPTEAQSSIKATTLGLHKVR